ncbi:unnamed protein product [Effrenium voratum]|nr:unnamed protein product [Effrenium voratum]
MYLQWRTPHLHPERVNMKSCLFTDARDSGPELLECQVRGWRTTVVTDRHALAAHEFWHRKTGGCWMDPQWLEDGTRYSSSGRLLAVCAVPEARDELAQKRVRIRFAAADQVAVVDFAVEELSNTEFEVRVLEEARGRRALPDRLEDKATGKQRNATG